MPSAFEARPATVHADCVVCGNRLFAVDRNVSSKWVRLWYVAGVVAVQGRARVALRRSSMDLALRAPRYDGYHSPRSLERGRNDAGVYCAAVRWLSARRRVDGRIIDELFA